MDNQKFDIHIPADLHYSSMVRTFSEEILLKAGFSKEWAGRLKLVSDELFMNAVSYGSTKSKSIVNLHYEFDVEKIIFVIEDDGSGEKAATVGELREKIKSNSENKSLTKTSGRGLAMITTLWTDSFDIDKSSYGGIKITFTKLIRQDAPPAAPTMPHPTLQPEEAPVTAEQAPKPEAAPMPAVPEVPKGPVTRIKLKGEMEQYNIEEYFAPVRKIIETMPQESILEIDMAEVNYINSTFIGRLAGFQRDMLVKKGAVRLLNANDQIKEVLNLVGLSQVLLID